MRKRILPLLLLCLLLCGCAETRIEEASQNPQPIRSMELQFAHEFSVDYYEGGYKLITLGDGSRVLVIP